MKSILFALALLICMYSKATIPNGFNSDSSGKPWRISHELFIEKFGNNDTSKALIDLWFRNRKAGTIVASIATPIGALFGATFFKQVFKNPARPNTYAPVLLFSFGLLFSIFFLLSLAGILKIFRFSKKKLYKTLVVYQSEQRLPERIKEKMGKFMNRKQM